MAATKAKTRSTARKSASTRRKAAAKRTPTRTTARKWSQRVTETSDAMDLSPDVFTLDDPKKIAMSLKRSAERSHRRKSAPFRSAMSMLNFYINRAGKNLSQSRLKTLERAKDKLREAFGREPQIKH